MAAWFAAVLPYIPDVISLARPLFTRAKPQDKAPEIVPRQIVELQDAVTQNAESIKTLAIEMQKTIDALQVGAESLANEFKSLSNDLKVARTLSVVATVAALLAFCLAAFALAK